MIRAVLTSSSTTAYALTKTGLAVAASFLGAVIVSIAIAWSAFNNTHTLNNENRRLVSRLENVVMHQKTQILEAREANCKLKLYDVLSGDAGTILFRKVHALNKLFENGIKHTLEIVETIPSEKNCTGIFVEPKGKVKKQTGGLTPSDIKYANETLGEIIEEPRGFRHRNEAKVKKSIEHKKTLSKRNNSHKKEATHGGNSGGGNNPITTPPAPITPVSIPSATSSADNENGQSNNGNGKEKGREKKDKCVVEASALPSSGLEQELKVCK